MTDVLATAERVERPDARSPSSREQVDPRLDDGFEAADGPVGGTARQPWRPAGASAPPQAPGLLRSKDVLFLQRSIGNRATTSLLRSQPNTARRPQTVVEHHGRTTTAERPAGGAKAAGSVLAEAETETRIDVDLSPEVGAAAGGAAGDDGPRGHSQNRRRAVPAARRTFVQRDIDFPDIEFPDIDIPDLEDIVNAIPGYDMLTLVVGFDPATGRDVEITPSSLVEAIMGLAPGGAYVHDRLVELEVLQDVYDLISRQLTSHDLTAERLEREADEAWEEVDLTPRLDIVSDAIGIVERRITAVKSDAEDFAVSLVDEVTDIIKEAAIDQAETLLAESDEARQIWDLARAVLKYDPLRDEAVSATTEEIISKFLVLIGRETELDQMRARGTLTETAEWVDEQLEQFMGIVDEFGALVDDVIEALSFDQLPQLPSNLVNLARRGAALIERIASFATTVAEKVLELIKDALLGLLDEHAQGVPGFHLITVLLGWNPFTDEQVPRTAENIIKGFITLMPGGEEQYAQLAETGVIEEAAGRIEGAIERLGITQEFIVGLFTDLWNSFSIDDLVDPVGAFERIIDQFGEPIERLFEFVRTVVEEVFKLVLKLMEFPSELIGNIINNALDAFDRIQEDPVGFFNNLLEALKLGFSNFFDNVGDHLLNGLADWLLGGLEGAGITIPDELNLEGILDVILQVLGISVDSLWDKLAERIGQERVDQIRGAIDQLTGIWEFITDVQERGIVAIWEYISDKISGLWDMLLEQAQEWILTEIIEAVVTKLLSMLDPTGIMAVVNSFIAFFRAVQSAIEYITEILQIVDRYVATIAEIAAGSIEGAAEQLEAGLAGAIPVAIGFLANQVGLGDISETIREIIEGIRALVDEAIDWLLDRAMAVGSSVLGMFGMGAASGEEAEGDQAAEGDQTAEGEDVETAAPDGSPLDASDHDAVATAAVRSLEQTEGGTYESLRERLTARARTVEQRYSAMLGGNVALRVEFADPSTDAVDEDIDFTVVIAPNDTVKAGSSSPPTFDESPEAGVEDELSHAPQGWPVIQASQDPDSPRYWEKVCPTLGQGVVVEFAASGLRAWRDRRSFDIQHEFIAGPARGRQHYELDMWSKGEHGNVPDDSDRAHSVGQGTGVESPYGIRYASSVVNRTVQNNGIEELIRRLQGAAEPDQRVRVSTRTSSGPGLNLRSISYNVELVLPDEAVDVAEYQIDIDRLGEGPASDQKITADEIWLGDSEPAQQLLGKVTVPALLRSRFERVVQPSASNTGE